MSETTDCAKRASRARALRAKAESTEFPAEAETLREKADQLDAKNRELGYVEEPPKQDRFADAWEDFFGAQWKAKYADQKLKEYQEYIRRHEAEKNAPPCTNHDWKRIGSFNDSFLYECQCRNCGKREWRVDAPGGTAGSYSEHYVGDEAPPSRSKSKTAGPRRSRSSHAECYANGWHENSKAGRASCRRARG